MGSADGSAESQVPLQGPCVDVNGHHGTGGEPGHHCYYWKCAVAHGVVSFGLLIAVIALAVSLSGCSPAVLGHACPDDWVGYRGKCYYFSKGEGNWTYSRSHCSTLGASLTRIDTLQEMDFLLRYKGKPDHWIGLWRDPEMDQGHKIQQQPWKWTKDTKFNNWFPITGDGDCAYLNEKKVSSKRCTGDLPWICSKPDALTAAKEAPAG